MGQIITATRAADEELNLVLPEYLRQFPLHLQKKAEDALRAFQGKDFQRAAGLCDSLLEETDNPDIRVMRGQIYFSEKNWEKALAVFEKLILDYPTNLEHTFQLGMVYHAMGDFEQAVNIFQKLYPPDEYRPFYYTSFGDSLMRLGKTKQAREIFFREVEHFEHTGEIASSVMIDGVYQNLLLLDLEVGNGCFTKDMESYWRFLDAVPMDLKMQEHLSGTIYMLGNYLTTKTFRPQYKRFIEHIQEKNLITEQAGLNVLESGFIALEAQSIHEDKKINAMLEAFMALSLDIKKEEWAGNISQDSDAKMRLAIYEWYLCQYAPEHPEELEHIRQTYPHSYRTIEDFVTEIRKDIQQAAEKRLALLAPYYGGKSIDDVRASMTEAYQRSLRAEKEPSFVYDGGDTYKRIQPKVGRNDSCPCGSGKKYKKCCGRF